MEDTPLNSSKSNDNLSIRPVESVISSVSQFLGCELPARNVFVRQGSFPQWLFSFYPLLQLNIAHFSRLISCATLNERPVGVIHQRACYFRPNLTHQKCLTGEFPSKNASGRNWQKPNKPMNEAIIVRGDKIPDGTWHA